MNENVQIIEINGVKLEVDLRTARRIDTMRVGTRVKLLKRKQPYSSESVHSGVVVGFEPFNDLPTMIVCFLVISYNEAKLEFAYLNESTRELYDIIVAVDDELPIEKGDILSKMDREIAKLEESKADLERKRDFFLKHFGRWFEREPA